MHIISILIITILLGGLLYQRIYYHTLYNRIAYDLDSISRMLNLKEGFQLPYMKLSYDSIQKLLPQPLSDTMWVYSGELKNSEQYPWQSRDLIAKYKKNDKDTVTVRYVYWYLPYNDLPNLHISFIQDFPANWIAEQCVQCSNIVRID